MEETVTRDHARSEIRTFLLDGYLYGFSEEDVQDDTSLLDMGVLDSTGTMELVAFLSRKFGVQIDDSEIVPDNLDTVSAILNFLAAKGVIE